MSEALHSPEHVGGVPLHDPAGPPRPVQVSIRDPAVRAKPGKHDVVAVPPIAVGPLKSAAFAGVAG